MANELSFSASPDPTTGNTRISATYIVYNSVPSRRYSFRIYTKPKGSPDSAFSNGHWKITADTGVDIGVEVGKFEFNWSAEIETARLFSGCSWEIKVTAGSGGYDTEVVKYGFLSSDPVHPDTFYTIPERPTQQTQNIVKNGTYFGESGTCMANTCASAKEILEMRKGKSVLNYSICWFYGSDIGGASDGMYAADAFNNLVRLGIPPYEVVENECGIYGYPDVGSKSDSRAIFTKNGNMPEWALPQKISSYTTLNSSDTYGGWNLAKIQNALKRKGSTVIMSIFADTSFDASTAANTGWVGPVIGEVRGAHAMILLGYEVNNGTRYWIVQNSWTDYYTGKVYGKEGIYYVPWNWFTYPDLKSGLWFFYELVDDPNAPILPPIPIKPLKPPVFTNLNERGEVTLKWNNSKAEKYQLRVFVEGKSSSWMYRTIMATEYTWYDDDFESGYTVKAGISEYRNGKWIEVPGLTTGTIVPYPINLFLESTSPTNIVASLDMASGHGKASAASIRRHKVGINDYVDYKIIQIRADATAVWEGLKTGDLWNFSCMTYLDTSGGRLWSYYRSSYFTAKVGALRPKPFKWEKSDPKERGKPFDITKTDWDNLCENINLMLEYKNKPKMTFIEAQQGKPLTWSMFNQVRGAIYYYSYGLSSNITIPSASWNQPITAEHMNKLKESLNSVK